MAFGEVSITGAVNDAGGVSFITVVAGCDCECTVDEGLVNAAAFDNWPVNDLIFVNDESFCGMAGTEEDIEDLLERSKPHRVAYTWTSNYTGSETNRTAGAKKHRVSLPLCLFRSQYI
ncbi:hypothetical protein NDU88_006411 [Pleurodeles waltl]|uniref:Uncharacterized protein n=1 Tax=Pleurodeles waltl TaxID=8319 RepID=A0AAV7QLP0_PLEWA|nr:hypothetical protein NDU88_006411 [Pleurodeles waltl]